MLRIDKWAFSCGPPPTLQLSSHLMYLHCILSFYLQQTQKYEHKSRPQQESRADRSLSSCAEYEKTWWMRPFGTTYLSLFTKESKTKKIHYAKERKIKKEARTGTPLHQLTHRNASSHHVEGTPLTHARSPFHATRLQNTNRRRTCSRADTWSSPSPYPRPLSRHT